MSMPQGIKAIDASITLSPPKGWLRYPVRSRFKDSDSLDDTAHPFSYLIPGVTERMRDGATADEVVGLMDQAGIEKAVLTILSSDPDDTLNAIEQYSDRFVGVFWVNPRNGMDEIRKLERMVKEHSYIKGARLTGHDIQKPYNDKMYFPVYAKCIELDIPVTANVGIPAARVPGDVENPIYLDEVCWFFPELKVIMTHGGEPWQFTCVKLMLKWPNLYYMTNAFAPRHYPKEIIDYLNTRGTDKVMFATGYPILPIGRCLAEVKDLPLRDHVWPKFLRENAIKVFKL